MKVEDFLKDLPEETQCDDCGLRVAGLDWGVGRFGAVDWMALCLVRCVNCGRIHVAAAGTSAKAHRRAQRMRQELVLKLEAKKIRHRWQPGSQAH